MWECWIISALNFVTSRDCLLRQSRNSLYFIACMHISACLLYTGHPKKTVIDLSWKRVGKNHILLHLGGELLLRPGKRKNVGKIFTETLLFLLLTLKKQLFNDMHVKIKLSPSKKVPLLKGQSINQCKLWALCCPLGEDNGSCWGFACSQS